MRIRQQQACQDLKVGQMANVAPPFFCPKCGKEVGYTYDARTGRYTPDECRRPNCSKLHSSIVN